MISDALPSRYDSFNECRHVSGSKKLNFLYSAMKLEIRILQQLSEHHGTVIRYPTPYTVTTNYCTAVLFLRRKDWNEDIQSTRAKLESCAQLLPTWSARSMRDLRRVQTVFSIVINIIRPVHRSIPNRWILLMKPGRESISLRSRDLNQSSVYNHSSRVQKISSGECQSTQTAVCILYGRHPVKFLRGINTWVHKFTIGCITPK